MNNTTNNPRDPRDVARPRHGEPPLGTHAVQLLGLRSEDSEIFVSPALHEFPVHSPTEIVEPVDTLVLLLHQLLPSHPRQYALGISFGQLNFLFLRIHV